MNQNPQDVGLNVRDIVVEVIDIELRRAYAKHGKVPWSRHEFYAVMLEEVDELWDAIKRDEPLENVIAETIEVAAMCVRFLETSVDPFAVNKVANQKFEKMAAAVRQALGPYAAPELQARHIPARSTG